MAVKISEHLELKGLYQAATAKIAELEKKLKDSESAKDMWYRAKNDAENLIEQVNQVLDAVPNSIPREKQGVESWNRVQLNVVTRLAAWLAIR